MRDSLELDPHVRDRMVNFGDVTKFGGAEQRTLFSLRLHESTTWTLYGSARVEGPPAEIAGVVPIVKVTWGHGGGSVEQEMRVLQSFHARVAASAVSLGARLVRPDGSAPPPSVRATITAFAARGVGEDLAGSTWVHQQGAQGHIASGPARIVRLSGFNVGSDRRRWVMLFDAVERPSDGAVALFAAPAMRFASQPFAFSGADFMRGVFWCASSSPSALAFDAGARLRIDAEVRL